MIQYSLPRLPFTTSVTSGTIRVKTHTRQLTKRPWNIRHFLSSTHYKRNIGVVNDKPSSIILETQRKPNQTLCKIALHENTALVHVGYSLLRSFWYLFIHSASNISSMGQATSFLAVKSTSAKRFNNAAARTASSECGAAPCHDDVKILHCCCSTY